MAGSGVAAEGLSEPRLLDSPLPADRFPKEVNRFYPDRAVYFRNDPPGQLLGLFGAWLEAPKDAVLSVELRRNGKALDSRKVGGLRSPLIGFELDPAKLAPGEYTVRGTLIGPDGRRLRVGEVGHFRVAEESRPEATFPAEGLPLAVHPARRGESGAFPISLGIPMPYGALRTNEVPVLVRNGKAVAAQWQPLATWGPGEAGWTRWLGLTFTADFVDGSATGYRLLPPGAASSPQETPLRVEERAGEVVVETGPLRFVVSKTNFRGPEQIATRGPDGQWVPVGEAAPGPYIETAEGERFRASECREVELRIEERGPVRVEVVASGWYVRPGAPEQRRCRFRVRLHAYAGASRIDLQHRTILTDASRELRLADVGFALPAGAVTQWAAGIGSVPGEVRTGVLGMGERLALVQDAPDSVRLNGTPELGQRLEGWLVLEGGAGSVLCLMRDIWQKYPKEISATAHAVTFHSWPAGGTERFPLAEQLERGAIHRALFAHQGKTMDLELPRSYYERLLEWHSEAKWDRENTAHIGFRSTAEGVSLSSAFAVEYLPPGLSPKAAAEVASLWLQNPHAHAGAEWSARSGVFGPIAGADAARWPEAEQLLGTDFPVGMMNLAKLGKSYGMWIYGNTNNGWELAQRAPRLHRLWQNAHYGHVATPWVLYGRSGSPHLIEYARANTGNLMDVGMVHEASEATQQAVGRKRPGALYHAKGWLPWGARLRGEFERDLDLGYLQHWTNPRAFLYKYYTEIDREALDLYRTWLSGAMAFAPYAARYGAGRELTCSLSEMLDAYQATWDARLLGYLNPMGESALAVPFRSYQNQTDFAFFNRTWPMRYEAFTRDPRVVEQLEAALADWPGYLGVTAFVYSRTRKPEYLERLKAEFYNAVHAVHRSPGDALDGFGPYSAAVKVRELEEYPYVLKAYEDAGLPGIPAGGRGASAYPAGSSRPNAKEGFALRVLALNEAGADFTVRLETAPIDMNPVVLVVRSPSGVELHRVPLHSGEGKKLRYPATAPFELAVQTQGEKGVYTLDFLGQRPIYKAPVTNLPHEVAQLPPGPAPWAGRERIAGILQTSGQGLKLAASGPAFRSRYTPSFLKLRNLHGGEAQQTTLLEGSARSQMEFPLAAGPDGRVRYEIMTINPSEGPLLSLEGAAGPVYFALREEDLEVVLAGRER